MASHQRRSRVRPRPMFSTMRAAAYKSIGKRIPRRTAPITRFTLFQPLAGKHLPQSMDGRSQPTSMTVLSPRSSSIHSVKVALSTTSSTGSESSPSTIGVTAMSTMSSSSRQPRYPTSWVLGQHPTESPDWTLGTIRRTTVEPSTSAGIAPPQRTSISTPSGSQNIRWMTSQTSGTVAR